MPEREKLRNMRNGRKDWEAGDRKAGMLKVPAEMRA